MFNLLTEEQKKIVKREYHLRLVFVIFCWLISIGMVLFIYQIPFLYLSMTRSKIVNEQLEKTKAQNASRDYAGAASTVQISKESTEALKPVLKDVPVREIVLSILAQKGTQISIKNISWTRDQTGGKLNVSGSAKTRESLQTFRNKLVAVKGFTSVDLPVSSYSKMIDLDFNLSIIYKL